MQQVPDAWQFTNTVRNLDKMRDRIDEPSNALYAAYPQRTFARPLPLSHDDEAALGLKVDHAEAVAPPLQGGVPNASTTNVGAAYAAAAKQSFRTPPPGVAPVLPGGSQPLRVKWPPPRPTPAERVHTSPQPIFGSRCLQGEVASRAASYRARTRTLCYWFRHRLGRCRFHSVSATLTSRPFRMGTTRRPDRRSYGPAFATARWVGSCA